MATTRISALTELTNPASADVLVINDASVGSTKKIQLSNLIPDDAIDSEHYVAGSIDNEHLADDAVDSDELASGAVDIDHLSATGTASSSTFLRGDNSWVTPTDTNTMGSGFTVSATTDSNATTITQGDDLMFTAGTGITTETTADGTVTIASTVTDTNTMGSGFTVSATTDSNATTITQGDDLMFTAGTGITCETTADGTVTITNTVTDTNTTYSAGDFKLDDLGAPDDNTDLDFTTSAHGLVPKGTNTGNFLKDNGTWAAPTSTGIDDSATATTITIDSDDQVGIRTTPRNFLSSYASLSLGGKAFLWDVGDEFYVGNNAYHDGSWKYTTTDQASYLKQMDGVLTYANAASGSADAAITFTDRFTIGADGATNVVGAFSKGSGSFRIDHPLPSKKDTHNLVHSFIEGPKADLIYRGRVSLVDGSATVNIDTDSGMTDGTFVLLCDDVQCFTSNETDWDCVRGNVSGNVLTIDSQDTNSSAIISWMVVGDRKDEHMTDSGTSWTDDNGKPIVEKLKLEEPS